MIALRKSSEALRRGDVEWLHNSDEARVISYLRRSPHEEVLVVVNFSNRSFFGSVETQGGETFKDVTPDIGAPLPPDVFSPERGTRARVNGLPSLSLDAWGYRIFQRRLN